MASYKAMKRFSSDLSDKLQPDPRDAELAALRTRVAELEGMVARCARQFQFYQSEHRKKGTPDGDLKAETNGVFVDMCVAALASGGRAS